MYKCLGWLNSGFTVPWSKFYEILLTTLLVFKPNKQMFSQKNLSFLNDTIMDLVFFHFLTLIFLNTSDNVVISTSVTNSKVRTSEIGLYKLNTNNVYIELFKLLVTPQSLLYCSHLTCIKSFFVYTFDYISHCLQNVLFACPTANCVYCIVLCIVLCVQIEHRTVKSK